MTDSNRSRLSWKALRWPGLLMGLAVTISLVGQAADVHPHHLVGHEEAELLARVQDVIDDWDPRKLENPLVETSWSEEDVFVRNPDGTVKIEKGQPVTEKKRVVRKQLRRSDLAEFIADVDAAEALGKAFFWEMQAGSDFEVTGTGDMAVGRGTACASCHYRNGADARNRHTARIPHVVWDKYQLHPDHKSLPLEKNGSQLPFPVDDLATQSIDPNNLPFGKYSRIIGSQGVAARRFQGFEPQAGWMREQSVERPVTGAASKPDWEMFGKRRQITARNSPTIINSGFSDRLFHDGRAESTFNGFSIFGDADPRVVLHRVRMKTPRDANGSATGEPPYREIVPVKIAITHAALASQAVGPIVNEVEMSYAGRQFPNVAHKLLTAKVLGFQEVSQNDSLLGRYPVGKNHLSGTTYRDLIRRAFRSEWWDDSDDRPDVNNRITGKTPLILLKDCKEDGDPVGSLMEGNFSLYWGLSIMLYEASLVSNQTPFDDMLRGRPEMVEAKWQAVRHLIGEPVNRDQKRVDGGVPVPAHQSGSAVFQHGFRVFLNHGCVDCHGGPFFSELYERKPEEAKFPIEYMIERALLPNSRSDALIANLRPFREGLLAALTQKIAAKYSDIAPRARKMAIEMEELRHQSRGRKDELIKNINKYLLGHESSPDPNLVQDCAKLIFDYEKAMVSRLGHRTFFTEDERVAMAEALGGPVLVELMPVPPIAVLHRRPLPIAGPHATDPYAFYDLGFYPLGVSPPRYDRGNGQKVEFEMTPEEHALLDVTGDVLSNDAATADNRELALEALKVFRRTGDANAAVLSLDKHPADLPKESSDKRKQYATQMKNEIQERAKSASIAPTTSTPGSAYRLKASWRTNRFQSEGYSPPKAAPQIPNAPAPNPQVAASKSRTSSQATLCKFVDTLLGVDTTWDRDDIPYGDVDLAGDNIPGPGRRSYYQFHSRARRMVFQEEHWGYRKPFLHDNELAFWGAFKTPTLRNVELTSPYMHNGRLMSLSDVIDFYDDENEQVRPSRSDNPDKHPDMADIDFKGQDDKKALEFFLRCLTDDRVLYEQGPFDHPAIRIVNGYKKSDNGDLEEVAFDVSSVGENGHVGVPTSSFPNDK